MNQYDISKNFYLAEFQNSEISGRIGITNTNEIENLTKDAFGGVIPPEVMSTSKTRWRGDLAKRDAVWGLTGLSESSVSRISNAVCLSGDLLTFYIEPLGHAVGAFNGQPIFSKSSLEITVYDAVRGGSKTITFDGFSLKENDPGRFLVLRIPSDDDDSNSFFASNGMSGIFVMKIREIIEFHRRADWTDSFENQQDMLPAFNDSYIQIAIYPWDLPLQEFDFSIQSQNTSVSALSRFITSQVNAGDTITEVFDNKTYFPNFRKIARGQPIDLKNDEKDYVIRRNILALLSSQLPVLNSSVPTGPVLGIGMAESSVAIPSSVDPITRPHAWDSQNSDSVSAMSFSLSGVPALINTTEGLNDFSSDNNQLSLAARNPLRVLSDNPDTDLSKLLFSVFGQQTCGVSVPINVENSTNAVSLNCDSKFVNLNSEEANVKITLIAPDAASSESSEKSNQSFESELSSGDIIEYLSNDLVGYYDMGDQKQENTNLRKNLAPDAVIANAFPAAATLPYVPGKSYRATYFSNTSDGQNLKTKTDLKGGDESFAVSFWFNMVKNAIGGVGSPTILFRYYFSTQFNSNISSFEVVHYTERNGSVVNGKIALYYKKNILDNSIKSKIISSSNIELNKWYHSFFVFDKPRSFMEFFLDGESQGSLFLTVYPLLESSNHSENSIEANASNSFYSANRTTGNAGWKVDDIAIWKNPGWIIDRKTQEACEALYGDGYGTFFLNGAWTRFFGIMPMTSREKDIEPYAVWSDEEEISGGQNPVTNIFDQNKSTSWKISNGPVANVMIDLGYGNNRRISEYDMIASGAWSPRKWTLYGSNSLEGSPQKYKNPYVSSNGSIMLVPASNPTGDVEKYVITPSGPPGENQPQVIRYLSFPISSGYIYKSMNYGNSFSSIGPYADWNCISASSNGNIIFAGLASRNYIYSSINGGASWTSYRLGGYDGIVNIPVTGKVLLKKSIMMADCSSSGEKVVAVVQTVKYAILTTGAVTGCTQELYVSPNYGKSWTMKLSKTIPIELSRPRTDIYGFKSIRISADGTKIVSHYGNGDFKTLFVSEDFLATPFIQKICPENIVYGTTPSLSSDFGKIIYLGNDSSSSPAIPKIILSYDLGETWIQTTCPISGSSRLMISPDGQKIYIGHITYSGNSGFSYISENDGADWTSNASPSIYMYSCSFDGNTILSVCNEATVTGSFRLYTSQDSSVSWDRIDGNWYELDSRQEQYFPEESELKSFVNNSGLGEYRYYKFSFYENNGGEGIHPETSMLGVDEISLYDSNSPKTVEIKKYTSNIVQKTLEDNDAHEVSPADKIKVSISTPIPDDRIKSISFAFAVNNFDFHMYTDFSGTLREKVFNPGSFGIYLTPLDIIYARVGIEDETGEVSYYYSEMNLPSESGIYSIDGLKIQTRRDGSGFIDIYYNLHSPYEISSAAVEIIASLDEGKSWNAVTTSASGDIGNVILGQNRHIFWNPLRDNPSLSENNIVAMIIAYDPNGNQIVGVNRSGSAYVSIPKQIYVSEHKDGVRQGEYDGDDIKEKFVGVKIKRTEIESSSSESSQSSNSTRSTPTSQSTSSSILSESTLSSTQSSQSIEIESEYVSVLKPAPYAICCSSSGQNVFVSNGSSLDGSIYYSENYGVSWTKKTIPGGPWTIASMCCSSDGTKLAIAAFSDCIFTCSISGEIWTWTEQTNSGEKDWGKIVSSDSGLILFAWEKWTSNLFISTDSGINWDQKNISSVPLNYQYGDIEIAPVSGRIFAATINNGFGLFSSENYGTDWTWLWPGYSDQVSWYNLATDSNGVKLYSVLGNYLAKSVDSGETWTPIVAASKQYQEVVCSSGGNKVIASAYNNPIFVSEDYGTTWTERTSSGNRNWTKIICSSTGDTIYATISGEEYVLVSRDFGITWTERPVEEE